MMHKNDTQMFEGYGFMPADDGCVWGSSKIYTHSRGLSCVYRQPGAKSHCNQMHGYALSVGSQFETGQLDGNNWVVDFGGLKAYKAWLDHMFDHTALIAECDPELNRFKDMHEAGVIDLRITEAVGCEYFAKMCYDWLKPYIAEHAPHVKLTKAIVAEHEGNSAWYGASTDNQHNSEVAALKKLVENLQRQVSSIDRRTVSMIVMGG